MYTILNLSHPLPEGREDVKRITGQDEYRVITVLVQLDLSQPLQPQFETLVRRITEAIFKQDVRAIVLPGYSVAAVRLWQFFMMWNFDILVLTPVKGEVPTRFEATELLTN